MVITINVATEKQPANNCIFGTGATNQVTGNCHLFQFFHLMAKRDHQVNTANNNFVDADGSETISFYLARRSRKAPNILPQHIVYVPPCCANYLLSIV
jgi:hypothetical protein